MKKIIHSQRPLILITNDDGIQARGLQQVAQFLKPLGDIVVVARSRVIYGRYDQLDRSFLQLMGKLGIRQTGEG